MARTKFDLRNVSILAFQPGGDIAQLASNLGRLEAHTSPVWAEVALGNIADIRTALDEIEAIVAKHTTTRGRR